MRALCLRVFAEVSRRIASSLYLSSRSIALEGFKIVLDVKSGEGVRIAGLTTLSSRKSRIDIPFHANTTASAWSGDSASSFLSTNLNLACPSMV